MKKISLLDWIIILAVLLGITGFLLVKTGKHQTSSKIIEKRSSIEFDASFMAQAVTSKEPLFKIGDDAFITLRNVPYTKLSITNVQKNRWKTAVYDKADNVLAVDDPSRPNLYTFIVTLKDNALITKDGAVIGGNKIKVGLPIVIEGFKYRLKGIVSDVRVLNEKVN